MKKTLAMVIFVLLCSSTFSILTPQVKATSLPPVGYWKFDEGSGNIAYDSSGHENNGTVYDTYTWTSGKFGNAINFTNGYVYVNSSTSLQIADSITVMAWVKVTGPTGDFKVICAKWYTSGGGLIHSFVLEFVTPSVEDERTPWFRVKNNTGVSAMAVSNRTIAYGQWAHIAGTYDGVTVKIYINGFLEGSTPLSGPINNGDADAPLMIGAHVYSGDRNWFNGVIDEVKIYNYSRTQEQIIEDMNIAVGGISIPVNKLELLAPYIGLTMLLAVAVTTLAYVRKRSTKIKRR